MTRALSLADEKIKSVQAQLGEAQHINGELNEKLRLIGDTEKHLLIAHVATYCQEIADCKIVIEEKEKLYKEKVTTIAA